MTVESSVGALVEVVVVDDNGRPVENASVYLSPAAACVPNDRSTLDSGRLAFTDAKGVARLQQREDGCDIVATHPRFQATSIPAPAAANRETTRVRMVLARGLTIAGRVVTEAGSPVSGMTVRALGGRSGGLWRDSASKLFGKDALPDVRDTVTGEDGAFEVTGLRAGNYLVTAIAAGYGLRHTPQGPAEYPAGAVGVSIVVAPTYVAHIALVEDSTGEAVSVANAIVEYSVANELGCRWDVGSAVDQIHGESVPSGRIGEVRQYFQATSPPRTSPTAEVTVVSIAYEPTVARVPLVPIGANSEPHAIRLRRTPGATGTVQLSLPNGTRSADLTPFPLLLRREGDADERWRRVSIALDTSGAGQASVPSGRYRLGGPFGYLVNGETSETVDVPEGGLVSVLAEVKADALGSFQLTVTSVSGMRLSDFYYRLVPHDAYARGNDNPSRQGWIGGEPPEGGPDVSAGWIAAREYVLVVTKRGWTQHIGRVSIRGGETTVHSVELEED